MRAAERLFQYDSMFKQSSYIVIEPSCGTGSVMMSFIQYVYLNRPNLLPKIQFVANDLSRTNIHATELNYRVLQLKGLPLNPLIAHNMDAHELLPIYKNKAIAVIGNPPFHTYSSNNVAPSLAKQFCTFSSKQKYAFECESQQASLPNVKTKANVNLAETFIELSLRLLQRYGVLSLYIPNGILSNQTHLESRKWILDGSVNGERIALLSVNDFPSESFKHSDTAVRTSLLEVMVGSDISDSYGVLMAIVDNVGWDSRLKPTATELSTMNTEVTELITHSYKNRVIRASVTKSKQNINESSAYKTEVKAA